MKGIPLNLDRYQSQRIITRFPLLQPPSFVVRMVPDDVDDISPKKLICDDNRESDNRLKKSETNMLATFRFGHLQEPQLSNCAALDATCLSTHHDNVFRRLKDKEADRKSDVKKKTPSHKINGDGYLSFMPQSKNWLSFFYATVEEHKAAGGREQTLKKAIEDVSDGATETDEKETNVTCWPSPYPPPDLLSLFATCAKFYCNDVARVLILPS